jgi:SEL1 protein
VLTHPIVAKKEWSLSEWLRQILEAEIEGWDEDLEPDDYDDSNSPMPGGDADYPYDDIDSEILESLVILALAGALAFLIYYRQQRQRRQEEERRRQEQQHQLNQVQAPVAPQYQQPQAQPQPQQDRGMFPHPNDPEFMDWAAGAIGH